MVIGRQRIAFLVIQAVAIGRHAGHENVAAEAVAAGPHGGFHLLGGGAALPIVNVVENHVETARGQSFAHGRGIVAVGLDVVHPASEIVLGLAVQNGDIVAALHQLFDQSAADEEGSADDQYLHMLLRQ